MNIKVTKDEEKLILVALQSHAAKLHDYANAYVHDTESARELTKEAGRCYDLCRKIRSQE